MPGLENALRLNITGWDDDVPKEGVKVCVFSYWNDSYEPLGAIAKDNWKAYCDKHNYALRFYHGGYHENPSMPGTYGDKGKFWYWTDLRGMFDIIMFLDIDSLFMNHNIKIEDQIGDSRFIWTYDDNGPLSGLLITRTDSTTERHMRVAYERASVENNVRHGRIEPNGISDQDSMRDLMCIPPFKFTFGNCVGATTLGHCYPENYEPGDWLVTFPGRSLAEKIEGMKKYVNLA